MDKESIQEIRNMNRCFGKIYHYYLKEIKIKLRLKTHPEYFFEGVVKEIELDNGEAFTHENIQEQKEYHKILRKHGRKFLLEKQIKEHQNEEAKIKQLQYHMEDDEEFGNHFILKDGDVETLLNTCEVDTSSIHPVEINPIAYFIRGNISEESRKIIRGRCNGLCEVKLIGCTGEMEEVDHWIPVSRGGSEDISNLRGACSHCNKKKSNKLWEEISMVEKI